MWPNAGMLAEPDIGDIFGTVPVLANFVKMVWQRYTLTLVGTWTEVSL